MGLLRLPADDYLIAVAVIDRAHELHRQALEKARKG